MLDQIEVCPGCILKPLANMGWGLPKLWLAVNAIGDLRFSKIWWQRTSKRQDIDYGWRWQDTNFYSLTKVFVDLACRDVLLVQSKWIGEHYRSEASEGQISFMLVFLSCIKLPHAITGRNQNEAAQELYEEYWLLTRCLTAWTAWIQRCGVSN